MYITYILIPFLSLIVTYIYNVSLKKTKTFFTSLIFFFICLYWLFKLVIIAILILIYSNNIYYYVFFDWINLDYINIKFSFIFDSLTCSMLLIILFITSIVEFYSFSYVNTDLFQYRFYSYLTLFSFFMILFVTSSNLIVTFIGWEGVGLVSYLLINFWTTRKEANTSSMKAIILNRFGDVGFLVALIMLFFYFGTFNFFDLNILFLYLKKYLILYKFEIKFLYLVSFFLFLGVVGKSSQLGLHTWLPDAMEGPTPVSSLLHAATMVTAGVFLVLRCSFLFDFVSEFLLILGLIGSLTAIFSASIGVFQWDIKKIIAYSTCSQLGYMVFICSLSSYSISLFHLINHAFFKALLFLGAGLIIHAFNEEQDIRKMGGVLKLLPLTYTFYMISSLSLCGFPFLSGFYSKDVILEFSYVSFYYFSKFCYISGLIAAFLTTIYSFKLIYLVFITLPNNVSKTFSKISLMESDKYLIYSLFLLNFGSIFSGYFLKDLYIGIHSSFFNNSLFNIGRDIHYNLLELNYLNIFVKLVPVFLFFAAFSLIILLLYSGYWCIFNLKLKKIITFLSLGWYFDYIYNNFSYFFLKKSYSFFYLLIDKGFLEFFGPLGLKKFFLEISKNISFFFQKNQLYQMILLTFFTINIYTFYIFIFYLNLFSTIYYMVFKYFYLFLFIFVIQSNYEYSFAFIK